ncbi:MAG: shikimate dehydrogenase [Ruminococcaceae bacterium]|nr:shikimate dehydrogenase [Oscillospiraceae bacterium]
MEYGLIGNPLGHSYSKIVHGFIGDYDYQITPILPEILDAFMKAKDFKGINVTIPYKKEVIPYCDHVDPLAERIGSVNTIVNRDGELWAYNTDYTGFSKMAERSGLLFQDKKVLILGSGGTMLTASNVVKDKGAASVTVVSRKGPITYEDLPDYYDSDILINTTPVGMYPNTDEAPVEVKHFTKLEGVLDVIYNPLTTKLVADARKMGVKAENGLYMLVAQAVKASELFFGEAVADEVYDRVYEEVINLEH